MSADAGDGEPAAFREALQRDLAALRRMAADGAFDREDFRTGMEVEIDLVTADLAPAMVNDAVLAHLDDHQFQTELGRFTIELNVPPRRVDGRQLEALESQLRRTVHRADDRAHDRGARLAIVGILPTLSEEHLTREWMSDDRRYVALDRAILAARGEPVELAIDGEERLRHRADSIAPEAACTSMQLHLQVSAERFADVWNAAQALAGPQLVMGANSPFLLDRHLWAETRIELFRQSTDTRPPELARQGVRPRVPFGDGWIASALELFEEGVRFYPPLLPVSSGEDPLAVLDAGGVPQLPQLTLHHGTIYRWNRPVYDATSGTPHLRVENRVLPAGPTVIDMIANAAFFYGTVVNLVLTRPGLTHELDFPVAQRNFVASARDGVAARLQWPGRGDLDGVRLVLDELLERADDGLTRLGVAPDLRMRYLGVIEGRARTRINPASWQVAWVAELERGGASRHDAVRGMFRRYLDHAVAGEPVHTWPMP